MEQWVSLVSSGGSAGAALTVTYFALQYIRSRDKDAEKHSDRVDMIAKRFEERIEAVASKFDATVRELHKEHRDMVGVLLTIQRETVEAISGVKAEVVSLRDEVRGRGRPSLPGETPRAAPADGAKTWEGGK